MSSKSITHRIIFLIDGIGALTSALLLGYVLIELQQWIGMPTYILRILALCASVFATYSITMHLLRPKKWKSLLRIIATINLSYCVLTFSLVILYVNDLTILGIFYFLAEIFTILFLVRAEFKVIYSTSK